MSLKRRWSLLEPRSTGLWVLVSASRCHCWDQSTPALPARPGRSPWQYGVGNNCGVLGTLGRPAGLGDQWWQKKRPPHAQEATPYFVATPGLPLLTCHLSWDFPSVPLIPQVESQAEGYKSSLTGCSCWPPFSSRSAARSSDVLVVGVESASRAPAVPAAVALRSFPEWQAGLSSVATRSLSSSSPVHAVPPAWRLGH